MPRDAQKKGLPFPFRQTIIWQVLVGWKGSYRAGDTFTTRTDFTDGVGCTNPVHGRGSFLLHVSGKEPYILDNVYSPRLAVDQFKYLERLGHEP